MKNVGREAPNIADPYSPMSVHNWRPARKFPTTYPGERPAWSYVLMAETVYRLRFSGGELWVDDETGITFPFEVLLEKNDLAPIHDRYRVLAYGANRNPATLHIKMHNYYYQLRTSTFALPALRATTRGVDVVAAGLTGQGYLYGDLLLDKDMTTPTEVETWVLLLDKDQLRALNDSEGIRRGFYSLGIFDDIHLREFDATLSALAYVSNTPILTSPTFGTPLAFSSISAKGRTRVSMEPLGMLDHLLNAYGLVQDVERVTGLTGVANLSAELMKYMNGQWWYQFNTSDEPVRGYRQVLELFEEAALETALISTTADQLKRAGKLLSDDEAYSPGANYRGIFPGEP